MRAPVPGKWLTSYAALRSERFWAFGAKQRDEAPREHFDATEKPLDIEAIMSGMNFTRLLFALTK